MVPFVGPVWPDVQKARALYHYNAETGTLVRKNSNGRWKAGEAVGTVGRNGYLVTTFGGGHRYVHRLVWLIVHGEWPAGQIDHIDRDRLNNRIENLRAATNAQNRQNMGKAKNNTSGVTGVYWHSQRGKWVAEIKVDRKKRYLGIYKSFEEAAQVRAAAKAVLHPFGVAP